MKINKYKNLGQGWMGESVRHSNAKLYGVAGGIYATKQLPIYKIGNKFYFRDVRLGEYRDVNDPNNKLDINTDNSKLQKSSWNEFKEYSKSKKIINTIYNDSGVIGKITTNYAHPNTEFASYKYETKDGSVIVSGNWEEGFFSVDKQKGTIKLSDDAITDIEQEISDDFKEHYTETDLYAKSKKDWKTGKLPFGLKLESKPVKMFYRVNPVGDVMVYAIDKERNGKKYQVLQLMGNKKWYSIEGIVSNATLKEANTVLNLKLKEW